MAIWRDPATPRKGEPSAIMDHATRSDADPRVDTFAPAAPPPPPAAAMSPAVAPPRRVAGRDAKESLLSDGLTIEGTIQGAGHIRIAGRFNGDVNVDGNLAIESGAKVVGGVVAATVTIAGELQGNIANAGRVELLESGILNGDLKAESLTVAAGSRMRGRVEFGWPEETSKHQARKAELGDG